MTDSSVLRHWTLRLEAVFGPGSAVRVSDESFRHAGHLPPGSPSRGTHAFVRVVSEKFEGLALPGRHRLVYDALGIGAPGNGLHALQVQALTPREASARGGQAGGHSIS